MANVHQHCRKHLARNHLVWDDHQKKQQEQYTQAMGDLLDEHHTWITLDNLEEKITEELFDAEAATTGLKTRYSQLWRTHVESHNFQLERLFNPATYEKTTGSTLEDRFLKMREVEFVKRRMVEDYLQQLVGTGEERENFQELVESFYQTFDEYEGMDKVEDAYAKVRCCWQCR